MPFYCAICDSNFNTKDALKDHTAHHPDQKAIMWKCKTCSWPFDDWGKFETHQLQSDHASITCDRCSGEFTSRGEYTQHRSWPSGPCTDFKQKKNTAPSNKVVSLPSKNHSSSLAHARHARPEQVLPNAAPSNKHHNNTLAPEENVPPSNNHHKDTPVPVENGILPYNRHHETPAQLANAIQHLNLTDDKLKCDVCHKGFHSERHYNNHFLGCRPVPANIGAHMATSASPVAVPSSLPGQIKRHSNAQFPASLLQDTDAASPKPTQNIDIKTETPIQCLQPKAPVIRSTPRQAPEIATVEFGTVPGVGKFSCKKPGCNKIFKSGPALQVHHNDIHGRSDQKLDLHGENLRRLQQKDHGRLAVKGVARRPPAPSRGRGRQPLTAHSALQQPVLTTRRSGQRSLQQHQVAPYSHPLAHVANSGGIADMEQAKSITEKILRLLIQSNIFIRQNGSISVCGIDWTRVSTNSQQNIVSRFESMVNLPANLQHDCDVPFAKAFSEDCKYAYPSYAFEKSPANDPRRTGLGIIALACSKVALEDGAQEVVKVAAVDLVTGRVLMNHLVCTSSRLPVIDWCSVSTGLFSWNNMESARSLGYKVFKGWAAVRAALHRFIDRDTIIVGHNLRPDLDSLRMSHGRTIDVAVMFERAANGPLTKSQLSLDSLSKDLLGTQLKSDPQYGRDVLMNTFAVRQIALWACKNGDAMKRVAIQKSLDLQRAGVRV